MSGHSIGREYWCDLFVENNHHPLGSDRGMGAHEYGSSWEPGSVGHNYPFSGTELSKEILQWCPYISLTATESFVFRYFGQTISNWTLIKIERLRAQSTIHQTHP
jgi:hypothetical protein